MTEPVKVSIDLTDEMLAQASPEVQRPVQILKILKLFAETRGLDERLRFTYESGDPSVFSIKVDATQEGITDRDPLKVAQWLIDLPDDIGL